MHPKVTSFVFAGTGAFKYSQECMAKKNPPIVASAACAHALWWVVTPPANWNTHLSSFGVAAFWIFSGGLTFLKAFNKDLTIGSSWEPRGR